MVSVALISSPYVEVPPRGYGGTERIIQALGEGLQRAGHTVTLYAPGDSSTNIPLSPLCDIALFNDPTYNHERDRLSRERAVTDTVLASLDSAPADIVNVHDYDNYALIERLSSHDVPVVVSFGHAVTEKIRSIYHDFKDTSNIFFHGLSKSQLESLDSSLPHIYNGLPDSFFEDFSSISSVPRQPYFFSIGDMKPIKAHKTAISLARLSGLDVLIAGKPYYTEAIPYFEQYVVPEIDLDVSSSQDTFVNAVRKGTFDFEGGRVIYFGTASDAQKKVLYKGASFLQFLGSLEVPGNIEACPTTVLESIVLGTPILGVAGSVTDELVDGGKTGYNVVSLEAALSTIPSLSSLDRKTIFDEGNQRFSSDRMAHDYLKLFMEVLSHDTCPLIKDV